MKKPIFAAILFCLTALAFGDIFDHPLTDESKSVFQKISQSIASHKVQKGDFTQTKFISKLKRELSSSGSCIISREDGIMWQTKKPFPSTMIVSASSVVQISSSGKKSVLQAEGNATFESFAKVIGSVFQGGEELSEKNFDIFFEGSEKAWSVGLIPREKSIRTIADRFLLQGGEALTSVTMHEKNGDFIRYEFANLSFPATLTDDEKAFFEKQ